MRIVLARAAGRDGAFARRLERAGHAIAFVPLTATEPLEPFPDPAGWDGVLFTSVNAVALAPVGAAWPRVAAVGPATAEALEKRGVDVAVVGTGGGRELAEAWGSAAGQRLLLPRAREAHPALAEALRAAGAAVTCVAVYRTVVLTGVDPAPFAGADVICFFAPSQVRAFLDLGVETDAKFWAHGPTTRQALLDRNLDALDDVL